MMTEKEQDAFFYVQSGGIKSASNLADKMGISRQRARHYLETLREAKLIEYEPAHWRIK